MRFLGLGPTELIILVSFIPLALLPVWLYWRIFDRAGMAPALALITLVPMGPLVLLFVLAFSKWPALGASTSNAVALPPAPPVASAPLSIGWHPDPHQRHELRYHDGTQWTAHVSDNGVQFQDNVA